MDCTGPVKRPACTGNTVPVVQDLQQCYIRPIPLLLLSGVYYVKIFRKRCPMDRTDFEQLYITLYPGLYRLAQSILRQEADAQDAVQQSAAKAWAAADRIGEGREKAYITRIVINECRNIQRHRHRIMPVEEPRGTGSLDAQDSELKAVVEALPETLRLPLLLRYMEGYSEQEAAAILRIPRNTLRARLKRARAKLRDEWIETEEESV